MIQGNSGFGMDLPPFVLAAEVNWVYGLNVIGLRRSGIGAAERAEIKSAFKLLYASGMNTTQALAAARERPWGPCATEFFDFVAGAKKRGICPLKKRAAPADDE